MKILSFSEKIYFINLEYIVDRLDGRDECPVKNCSI